MLIWAGTSTLQSRTFGYWSEESLAKWLSQWWLSSRNSDNTRYIQGFRASELSEHVGATGSGQELERGLCCWEGNESETAAPSGMTAQPQTCRLALHGDATPLISSVALSETSTLPPSRFLCMSWEIWLTCLLASLYRDLWVCIRLQMTVL